MVSTPNGRIWPPSSRPASRPTLLDRSGPRCPDSPVRTAIKILTIVGDGSAFPTAGHLAAYPGLAPVTRRSGTSIKGETRSQRGNHALKSALFLSAFASLADPASRAYYDRKRAQGKRRYAPNTMGNSPAGHPPCRCSRVVRWWWFVPGWGCGV